MLILHERNDMTASLAGPSHRLGSQRGEIEIGPSHSPDLTRPHAHDPGRRSRHACRRPPPPVLTRDGYDPQMIVIRFRATPCYGGAGRAWRMAAIDTDSGRWFRWPQDARPRGGAGSVVGAR